MDNMSTLQHLIGKWATRNFSTHLVLANLEKAYDTVSLKLLLKFLKNSIDSRYISALYEIYSVPNIQRSTWDTETVGDTTSLKLKKSRAFVCQE